MSLRFVACSRRFGSASSRKLHSSLPVRMRQSRRLATAAENIETAKKELEAIAKGTADRGSALYMQPMIVVSLCGFLGSMLLYHYLVSEGEEEEEKSRWRFSFQRFREIWSKDDGKPE
ncbi:MAG: hypothetical protein MHM6MM_001231 [Cercozoa sp. M6MM]